MIMIIGDVHGHFQVINEQIKFASEEFGMPIDAVIVLGDMGIYIEPLKKFFVSENQSFTAPVFFIDGNHEDFAHFDELVKKYEKHMKWLSRSQINSICGIRFLSLGGACYMDALNSPSGSEIKDCEIDNCLCHSKEQVDIILTHDCPCGIGVPNAPGFEYYGPPGFARSQELVEHFQPRKWFFGHHHRWFKNHLGNTEFHGLPESWKGFGILAQDLQFTAHEHHIQISRGWLQTFFKKLFG